MGREEPDRDTAGNELLGRLGHAGVSIGVLLFVTAPFVLRKVAVETRLPFLKSGADRFRPEGGGFVANLMDLLGDGFAALLLRFHELFSTVNALRSVTVSLVFLVPLGIFLFRRIRSGDWGRFWIVFLVLYMGGLVGSGTGFTRYWLPVLPLIVLTLVHELTLWTARLPSLGLPRLLASAGRHGGWAGTLLILAVGGVTWTLVENPLALKLPLLGAGLLGATLLVFALMARGERWSPAYLFLALLLVWHVGRSTTEFVFIRRAPVPSRAEVMAAQERTARFLNEELPADKPLYVRSTFPAWVTARTRHFTRVNGYEYEDEAELTTVHFLDDDAGEGEDIKVQFPYESRTLLYRDDPYRVYRVELR